MSQTAPARWELRLRAPMTTLVSFFLQEMGSVSNLPFAYEEHGLRGVIRVYPPQFPPSMGDLTQVDIRGFVEPLALDAVMPFGERTAAVLMVTWIASAESNWVVECSVPSFAVWLEIFVRHCHDELGSACEVIEGPGGMERRVSPTPSPSAGQGTSQGELRPGQIYPRAKPGRKKRSIYDSGWEDVKQGKSYSEAFPLWCERNGILKKSRTPKLYDRFRSAMYRRRKWDEEQGRSRTYRT